MLTSKLILMYSTAVPEHTLFFIFIILGMRHLLLVSHCVSKIKMFSQIKVNKKWMQMSQCIISVI